MPVQAAAAIGNELVFTQADATGSGESLWISDGTAGGTVQLQDFQPSSGSPHICYGIAISSLTVAGGTAYFVAQRGTDSQLWATNGTAAGTVPLTIGNAAPEESILPAWFNWVENSISWRTTPPADRNHSGRATARYRERTSSPTWAEVPPPIRAVATRIMISSLPLTIRCSIVGGNPSSPSGPDLWESDGTASGTTDLGSLPQAPWNLTANGANLFFTAKDNQGTELWSAQASADTNTHTHTNANTNTHADANTHADTDTNAAKFSLTGPNVNRLTNAEGDARPGPDADSRADDHRRTGDLSSQSQQDRQTRRQSGAYRLYLGIQPPDQRKRRAMPPTISSKTYERSMRARASSRN